MSIWNKLFGIKTRADKTADFLRIAKEVLLKAAEAGDLQAVKVLLEGLVKDGSPLLEDPEVQNLLCKPEVTRVFAAVVTDVATERLNRLKTDLSAQIKADMRSFDRKV